MNRREVVVGNARPFRRFRWSDPDFRSVVYQAGALIAIVAVAWMLVSNTLQNLANHNIATGFGFLSRQAGFAIGESVINYTPLDTYGRAVLVGMVNTLKVAGISIVLATIIGVLVAIARLGRNWMASRLALVYVEGIRNVPLLIQLFVWYALITQSMPGPRQAYQVIPHVFLSNRGLNFPTVHGQALYWMLGGLLGALLMSVLIFRRNEYVRQTTGEQHTSVFYACVPILVALFAGWLAGDGDLSVQVPLLKGLNFSGGLTLSPEFTALTVGLVVYTSAYIAEIVRSGISAIAKGQWEAAAALGLRRSRVLRLVILPQTLRVVIPPVTSQYLNLVKNSSLAVAIGYPDLVSVVDTTLNQTGQAIEGILIIMAAYMSVSLLISVLMNWYGKRVAIVER